MTDQVEALDVGAAFSFSREKYEDLVAMLSSAPTGGMTHSEVESLVVSVHVVESGGFSPC